MDNYRKQVLDYYNRLESKLGYKYLTRETKHFGYYPEGDAIISEQKARELMQDLIAGNLSLKPSSLVLDAGCGYGTVACYLAKKYGYKLTGIDINNYEITKAREKAKRIGVSNRIKFLVMDYVKTSFHDNYFEGIYTMETLSHAPQLAKTLKEFLRILKPGGKVALFEYTLAQDLQFTARELEMLNLGIVGTAALGLKKFRHDRFPDYLRRAGFISVSEQNITKNTEPSLRRLKRFAAIPYFFIRLLNLKKYFINTTMAVEWYELAKKDLIRYCIFTARKPKN